MMSLSTNSSVPLDYFAGFREWDELKYFSLGFHIIITFIGPGLLYWVIWYETYGCNANYRTVVNILLSHICWINLARCIITRIPHVIIMIHRLHSILLCDAFVLGARFCYLCLMTEILVWQVMKYIYIFHWKNVVAINDNFIACFLTTTNILLSGVISFVTYMKGFHNVNEEFHICTGKNPLLNFNQTPFLHLSVTDDQNPIEQLYKVEPVSHINTFIWLTLVFASLRIWVYSHKDELAEFANKLRGRKRAAPVFTISLNATEPQNPNFYQVSQTSLIGAAGSFIFVISVVLLMLPSMISRKIFIANVNEINHGYGRTVMYISRITLSILSYCLLPMVLILGRKKIRVSVWKELKQNCFIKLNLLSDSPRSAESSK